MSRRKGELSSVQIDRGWPHQVALPERALPYRDYIAMQLFCADLSLSPRGHTFVRDGQYFNVYCFAERTDAETFRTKFGGEFIDPKDRPQFAVRDLSSVQQNFRVPSDSGHVWLARSRLSGLTCPRAL